MTSTTPRLSLHVKITIAPSDVPEFFKALKPAYDAVIAEPECVFFEVYQSVQEPGVIRFVENWNASVDWLYNVQVNKDYYKPYMAVTEPMFIKPREFDFWERMPGDEWVYVSKEGQS